jgi:hypothetical protein
MIRGGKLTVLERPKGAMDYYALAVNDTGVVLGTARFSAPEPQRSVIWVNGKAILPDVSPAIGDLGRGPLGALNNVGGFVGRHAGVGPLTWSESGGVSYLPMPPGATTGGATGINDDGVIAGVVGSSGPQAARWSKGIHQSLHPVGYASSRAEGIASNGDIGGYVTTSNAFHGAFWRNGTEFVDIGALSSVDYTWFSDMNSHEQMVGQATFNNQFAAYLWEKGELYNLAELVDPKLNVSFGNATAIDEMGNVIAAGTLKGLTGRRMLLNPVPEPSTWVGVSTILFFWRIRR